MIMRKLLLIIICIFLGFINLKGQWIKTSGPNGGHAYQIVNIEDTLFVSGSSDGIFRSKDKGLSWEKTNNGLPENNIEYICTFENRIYASVEENGIFYSENMGESWIAINQGIENKTFYRILVNYSNIYASNSDGGIYYSSDYGQNWTEKSNGISDNVIYSLEYFDSKIFAGGDKLYYSSDNGDNWETIEIAGISSKITSIETTDTVMFLKIDNRIYVSTDSSKTWIKSGINTDASYGTLYTYEDTMFVTAGNGYIYYSINNWNSWNTKQNNLTFVVEDICILQGIYFMTAWDGIFKSVDTGANWDYCNNGFSLLTVETLSKNANYVFAGTRDKGIYRTNDNGENWNSINEGLDGINADFIVGMEVLGDTLFLSTESGLYKSDNNGDNWSLVFDPGMNKSANTMDFDKGIFVAAVNTEGVYISLDTAKTWTLTDTLSLDINTSYKSIVVKGDTIIVATHNAEIYLTTNGGDTWKNISIGGGYYFTNKLLLDNDKIYAATTRGLFISSDLGNSWSHFINEDEIYFFDLVIDSNIYYAATINGVYFTSENRDEWYYINEGLGNQTPFSLLLTNNELYTGTALSSVWKRSLAEFNMPPMIIDVAESLETPEENTLEINVADLVIDDPDNIFPDDFILTINIGNNYTIEGNKVTPNKDYNGTIIIPAFVSDGKDNSPVFNINVEVIAVNDTPVIISADALTVVENNSIDIFLINLTVTDPDNIYPSDFTITLYDGDNYTYSNNSVTPNTDFTGFLHVPVSVNDGNVNSDQFTVIIDVTLSTGINTIEKSNFNVYPNPAKSYIELDFSNEIYEDVIITITDITGKDILMKTYNKTEKQFQKRIELKDFNSGIYLIKIEQSDKYNCVKRILKI